MREFCAYACENHQHEYKYVYERRKKSYHWLDIRMRHGVKNVVVQLQLRPNVDVSTPVLSRIAVLWRRKDGDAASVVLDLVAAHADLVRANHGFEAVLLAETLGHVRTKLKTDASLAGTTAGGRLGVGPEHFHHETGLAWLALAVPVQFANVVERDVVVGEQATVQHKELVADEGGQRQRGEGLGKDFEDALVVLGFALAFKAVHLVHVVRLVVAAVQEELLRPQPLVRVQQESNFRRPRAAVDKVAVEQVCMCIGGVAIEAENLEKIKILAYKVSFLPLIHGERYHGYRHIS